MSFPVNRGVNVVVDGNEMKWKMKKRKKKRCNCKPKTKEGQSIYFALPHFYALGSKHIRDFRPIIPSHPVLSCPIQSCPVHNPNRLLSLPPFHPHTSTPTLPFVSGPSIALSLKHSATHYLISNARHGLSLSWLSVFAINLFVFFGFFADTSEMSICFLSRPSFKKEGLSACPHLAHASSCSEQSS